MQEIEEDYYSLASSEDPCEETLSHIMDEAAKEAMAQEKQTNGEFLMSVRKEVFRRYNS
jgi:hypothetical protein